MRVLFLVLGLSLCACWSNGSQSKSDAGVDGSSSCDEKDDCSSCLQCAQAQPCAALLSACQTDAACEAINECMGICGADQECQQGCYLNNPNGAAPYSAVLDCVYCDACPADCSGYRSCS